MPRLLVLTMVLVACGGPSAQRASREAATTTLSAAQQVTHDATREALMGAVEAESRTPSLRERDPWRHPFDTLMFFEIEPDDVVVELWPSTGYYLEILAPFLAERGKLIAAGVRETPNPNDYRSRLRHNLDRRLSNDPSLARVQNGTLSPPVLIDLGPPESADAVLTFRDVHNFVLDGTLPEVLAAAYTVLKPGGVLGIVDHRAAEGKASPYVSARKGYVPESFVKASAEHAGFEFVGSSEINGNPRDTRDHPEGVWTLPPTLRLGDLDREKYLAIGESDRMTLKFRKPLPGKRP